MGAEAVIEKYGENALAEFGKKGAAIGGFKPTKPKSAEDILSTLNKKFGK